MDEPVKNFAEFKKKYGSAPLPKKHVLTTVKRSFYSRGLKVKKKRKHRIVRGRARIENIRGFNDLPQAHRYASGVPRGFGKGGWEGEPQRHSLAAQGIRTGRKDYSPRKRSYTTYVSPASVRLSKRFSGSEFDLNKVPQHKYLGAPVRGAESAYGAARGVARGYADLRAEALTKEGVYAPPTAEDVGAGAIKRDIQTGTFYGSKTVGLVKGGLKFLQEQKIKRDQAKKDKLYAEAQDRAEKSRIARLELQTEMENKKLAELRGEKPKAEEVKPVVSEQELSRVQARNQGLLGSVFARKPAQLNKEEAEKEYARV